MTLTFKQRLERLNRPCKRCGNPLNSLRVGKKVAVFCSLQCRIESKKSEIREVKCCICQKQVTKSVSKEIADDAKFCCSLDCQRQLALVDNRGSKKTDWDKRSGLAKEKWKRTHSKTRQSSWFNAVRSKLSKIVINTADSWHATVRSRLASSLGRKCVKRRKSNHSRSIAEALVRLERKRNWHDSCSIYKKVVNKLSNIRKRRARKNVRNVREREKGGQNCCEDKGVWLQMCFNWMED